jgi:putative oxidoreductase
MYSARALRLDSLEPYAGYGAVFIRLLIGHRLVVGTADNVFSPERMHEFAAFLSRHGFPAPLVSAHVSAYAQLVCGTLIVAGALVRPAAAVMAANFVVALLMVHLGRPYLENFDALAMLAGSLFLLLHGAGALSVDAALAKQRSTLIVSGGRVPAG